MIAEYRYKPDRLITLFLLLTSLILTGGTVRAAVDTQEGENTAGTDAKLTFEITERDYEYQIENRPDPFVPFYTGERATAQEPDPNEIVEVEKELTGMQLFEPGQLRLVALMKMKDDYLAMVEDTKGQGYLIEEGTKIGRRGVVKEISPKKVVIEETAVTRAGRELKSEITMALRKEGEE